MSPDNFLELVYFSNGILGNSSAAIRACSYLGLPSINIGSRQNGREMGKNVTSAKYNKDKLKKLIKKKFIKKKLNQTDTLYGNGQVGSKIAKVLSSLI